MRVYINEKTEEIFCNKCSKKIEIENGIAKEGVLSVDYKWGYFSKKDGMQHSFDICEKCYDEIVNTFIYPVSRSEYTELI